MSGQFIALNDTDERNSTHGESIQESQNLVEVNLNQMDGCRIS